MSLMVLTSNSIVVVRGQQDKNDEEVRKKRKENPVGCTEEGKK